MWRFPLMNLQHFYDWLFRQNSDGTGIPLKETGLVLGALLLLAHLGFWLGGEKTISFVKTFSRHRAWGIALMLAASIWGFFLVAHMDMGEFYNWREKLMVLVLLTFVLVSVFVPEFLAVRALGALMLMAAALVLQAAFLHPQTSRLLLPILAYAWIIAGMFFVGMPYLLRDWITWVTQSKARWNLAVFAGATYGALMLVVALIDY